MFDRTRGVFLYSRYLIDLNLLSEIACCLTGYFFKGFTEIIYILDTGRVEIYLDKAMWMAHGMLDLWMIAIGLVCRIVFYYPTWKFFRPYPCIKVR